MVKKYKENITYNKKSIYSDLKEFHDRNLGELYSYQDFEKSGIKEYKNITNKSRQFLQYEKNRLAEELTRILLKENYDEEKLRRINEYITTNPIIGYFDSFLKLFKDNFEANAKLETKYKLRDFTTKILIESGNSEEIKLAILMGIFCEIDNIKEILEVFSIHNDYLFYVIKALENMGDCNNIIFEIAKKSYGYGKVFALMNLTPTSYEIKKWMIEDGCNNNVGVTELLSYSMLSLDIMEYLENTDFTIENVEVFSKYFSILLSEYGIDEIKDLIKVCNKFLGIINDINGGIYSLYAVISIIYSIEAVILEDYKNGQKGNLNKFNDEFKDIIENCKKIYGKEIWHKVIASAISNAKIESSVIISCAEKTKYKLRKKEFEIMLSRDFSNALLYKYAFSVGSKAIKKIAFDFGLEKLPMTQILRGQDELKIENLEYDDIFQICFFIIIKYLTYDDFKDRYKEINLQALNSPVVETRNQAISNLQRFKGEFNSFDNEIINDAINSEMVPSIRKFLKSLTVKTTNKIKKYVEISGNMIIEPHVRDIYLITLNIARTNEIDMNEIYNKIFEDDILYLKSSFENPEDEREIEIVTTWGYVIGYVPSENNIILRNLLDKGKYIYGKIKEISEEYNKINIKIYLSYKDIIEEITSTLSLLSSEKEFYLQ